MTEAARAADPPALKIGGRYNWKNQPERLVYVGLCEPRNGRWHQFAKVENPAAVWCEVLDSDLRMMEETPQSPAPYERAAFDAWWAQATFTNCSEWHAWQARAALASPAPLAWMVRSTSAGFKGLYQFEGHAEKMLNDCSAPKDAELIPLVDGRAAPPSAAPPVEPAPFGFWVYIPDEQRGEFVHDLDDAIDDLTNCDCEVTRLYAALASAAPEEPEDDPGDESGAWHMNGGDLG